MGAGKDLDDTSEGGLVWYLGVDGPDRGHVNNYGVRVRNGGELREQRRRGARGARPDGRHEPGGVRPGQTTTR